MTRRKSGEGSIREYKTADGKTRWLIVYRVPDLATGKSRQKLQRGFTSQKAASKALRDHLVKVDREEWIEPSKLPFGHYLDTWLAGMRISPSTRASYAKNLRLHVKPRIGGLPLRAVTASALDVMYRDLEESGRADGKPGGLSARTVRYIATIVGRALRDAVRQGLLLANPADRATPPSAKEAKAPEMHVWTGEHLAAFLGWSKDRGDDLHPLWLTLAMTGCRRGEALALRWGDLDVESARLSIRRSAGLVRTKGEGEQILIGGTKTDKPRVVDLDPQTVATLKAYRSARAEISLSLVRTDALMFGTLDGQVRHPERTSRTWQSRMAQIGADRKVKNPPPAIRLHDLRHTHASLMLGAGVPVRVVSERLGHASATITLGVYAHVMPGHQADAASKFATLVFGAQS
jgi:integrase